MLKSHTIFDRFIYNDELPLEVRLSNIVYFSGLVGSSMVLVTHILAGSSLYLILVVLAIVLSIIVMVILVNAFSSLYTICRRITIAVLCYILFPIAYFALGGLDSSMPAYFALSIVLLFLFSSGKFRVFLLCLHIAEATACYYLSSLPFFDSLVVSVNNRYVDAIQTFIVVGLCIGTIVTFQKKLYTLEGEKVSQARDELFYRGKLLRMVNRVAELLLYAETKHPEDNFKEAMEVMVRCIDADRMYIWRNRTINGKLNYFQEYEWIDALDAKNARGDYYYHDSIPAWEEKFAKNEIVNGPLKSLSEMEQKTLSPFGIVSILVIPILLKEKFWGFVSFDDCHREKIHSDETVAMLHSACLLIANASVRNSNDVMINSRLKQQELMAAISQRFISRESMADLIQEALRRIGEFLKVTRILMIVVDKDSGQNYPVYAWFCEEKWKPSGSRQGLNELITSTFPQQMPAKGMVPTRLINDILTDEEGRYAILAKADNKSFIWAPVYVDGLFWGMITVEQCDRTRMWSDSDVQLVGMASGAIAGAVARDLMEKERSAALQQALQASLAKGNFLSNMSHEMRTPMNAIIGMTNIAKTALDVEKKNYCLSKIEDASNHLLGVINDILDMSKIEANKLELSPISFNFEKMLQKVVNVINFRVEERRQNFYVTIDNKIPRVLIGDDQRLAQVITNLLSNAVKFTPEEGTIRLNAQYQGEDGEDCLLQIEVVDSGIGISKEQQNRLFNSFVQAESSTTRKYGGTGLGLAISKQIVEIMGGEIGIESELGKGSTFIVKVPLKRDKQESKHLLNAGVNWSNVRVLAVDDDAEICSYFADIAKRFGIKCDTARSGEEVIKLIEEKGGYDIYFIDWKMPGMDGVELSEKIKAMGGKSVITMISAAAFNEIEDDAKKAGVEKFLSKPIFPSDIADWINICLGVPIMPVPGAETSGLDKFDGNCILLVEDVEINREIVLALLEPTELVIDCAENGVEALRMVSENPGKYDMIFMDVQMPEMDGYEATRRIRALEDDLQQKALEFTESKTGDFTQTPKSAKRIPIVAMTANVFREDIEKSLAAGMNDHVGKPLDFTEVITKLHKYLPGRGTDNSRMIRYGEAVLDEGENWKYGIAWSPDLATGNKEIDSQHKQLFRLTSSLAAACIRGQGQAILGDALEFLAAYTVQHFADEEALQKKYDYPAYEEHKKMHDDFKTTVAGLIADYKEHGSTGELLEKVNAIIVRWLVEHIKKEDSKIADYIRRNV
jgi:hemerythrin-like metal-binding protein